MKNIHEELLSAWLRLSTTINNERLVSKMTFNEALICNILYRNKTHNPDKNITATDLCNETKMLKSQMNRTLNSLEAKQLIIRERSLEDKRCVYVSMNMDKADIYYEQHAKIMELMDRIVNEFGEEKAYEIIELFTMISDRLEGVM